MNSTAHILGEHNIDIEFDTSSVACDVTQQLVSQAQYTIDIYSQQLTDAIYNHQDIINSMKRCLLASRHSQLRILISHPDYLSKKRHHLTTLIQQVTSNLAVRKIHPDYAADPQDFLIVDGRGLLRRRHGDRFEGIANFNDPAQAKELTNYFNEVWNHSQATAELRRLYI